MRLEVFDKPQDSEQARASQIVSAAEADLVNKLQQAERDNVHWRVLYADSKPIVPDILTALTDAKYEQAKTILWAAKHRLQDLAEPWHCATLVTASPPPTPLSWPVCSEIGRLGTALDALELRLSTIPNGGITKSRVEDGLLALTTPDPPQPGDTKKLCAQVKQLRWLEDRNAQRLIARAEVPLLPGGNVFEVDYGRSEDESVLSRAPLGMIVKNVPSSKMSSFAIHQGNVVESNLAALVGEFFKLGVTPSPGGSGAPPILNSGSSGKRVGELRA